MKFGPVAVAAAEGAVLAHTHRLGERGVLKKGRVLTADDAAALAAAGHTEVVVARLEDGDVGEDEAAAQVAAAAAGDGARCGEAATGRVNLHAAVRGLALVDAARVDAVNAVHEAVTVATVEPGAVVAAGDMIATVKIIPFAAPAAAVERAAGLAASPGPLLAVAPFAPRRAGLVLTRLPGVPESLLDRAAEAQRARMAYFGGGVDREHRCAHRAREVAAAIAEMAAAGRDPILVLGASAIVDRGDVVPRAIVEAGGEVVHLGMPVDPGNLIAVGRCRDATVVGLPGCARSLKPSGLDLVLARVVAGLEVDSAAIAAMGAGGLLDDIRSRPHPRDPRAAVAPASVAAVVLAAGQSSRMGATNKLTSEVGGVPMIRRVVDAALASAAGPCVVVTGHDAASVRDALAGIDHLRFVHNPHHERGMSSSIRAGIDGLDEAVGGALFVLGDMPWVEAAHIDALVAAFDPAGGAGICVPVYERKRGNPVLWGARYFPEMRRLSGDTGARRLLEAHAADVCYVSVDDPGVTVDIDTPEALAALRHEPPRS